MYMYNNTCIIVQSQYGTSIGLLDALVSVERSCFEINLQEVSKMDQEWIAKLSTPVMNYGRNLML